jgi:glycosyltransferase involved in cell wall biosynthesis
MTAPNTTAAKRRVAVIYDGFPHYRRGIIEELAASDRYEYYFFCDEGYRDQSIKAYSFKPGINVVRTRSFTLGPYYVQRGILGRIRALKISLCIFLGNPWFASYWLLTPLLRLLGKKVLFWTHGWISAREPFLRRTMKSAFFKLPNGLLLYGRRSRQIGLARGFAAERMSIISNSLDYRSQKGVFDALSGVQRETIRRELGLPLEPKILICTARLTKACRFDILLHAAHQLLARKHDVFVLLVGDGPESQSLAELGASLDVPLRLWGPCYDELALAKLYKASDLTVSPGKVGLTAMHSMAYGTPVISHDNLDRQMPEFESIVAGATGDFFVENSSDDLASVIAGWFGAHAEKPERECVARIEAEFTPTYQRGVIEAALASLEATV